MSHMTTAAAPATCTIVTGAGLARCGETAVHSFTSRTGTTYHECAAHFIPTAAPVAAPVYTGPATATIKPFVLVAAGRIVGYAATAGPEVAKRAAKLGAKIVATGR